MASSMPWCPRRSPAGIENGIDVLGQLQHLVVIGIGDAHAGADQLQDVEHLEGPVALMRAQLAVIDVIDRDQRVDAGVARRLKFRKLQLLFVLGQRPQCVAHQADRRLPEIDELDSRNGAKQFQGGLDHAGNARMPVQRDPHGQRPPQHRAQGSRCVRRESA